MLFRSGDNEDMFPSDATGKYDSDRDGIADAVDAFPNNAGLDSWFDVALRIVLLAVLLAGVAAFIKNRNNRSESEQWTHDLSATSTVLAAEEGEQSIRPTGPPPADAFVFDNQQ